MKRLISIFILLVLLTGCSKNSIDIEYDGTYYQVFKPYKNAIGSYSIDSYDKQDVETMLMNLSTNYFKINNSFYQEGQYLTNDELKTLIETYNETLPIKVDNVEIKPQYIISIYEQNYLTYNGNIKGISLAMVVNNKQYYGQNSYKIVDENIALDYAKEKAQNLVNYLYQKEGLENIKIIVGIYLQSNTLLPGGFKYVGICDNDEINFQYVNYNYQSLDSNYVMNNDMNSYNAVLAIKQSLNDYNTLYLNPIGLYKDKELVQVNLTVNKSYLSNGQILTLSSIITNNFNAFPSNVQINVYFKSNNMIKAYTVKKNDKIQTFILEE